MYFSDHYLDTMKYFDNPKTKIYTGILAALLIGVAAFFIFRKAKTSENKQVYAKYIEAYTSGVVSKKSTIRIQLAGQVNTIAEIGKAEERKLFSISPSISGKTYWLDAQTIEFRPDEEMEPGQEYDITFKLDKITPTEEGLEEFDFRFRVIKPGLAVREEGLVSQNNTSLNYMKIRGEISTADEEDPQLLEKTLSLNYHQKLKIKWQHNPKANLSVFTIDSIRKTDREETLAINWSGDPIKADQEGKIDLKVPAAGVFKVLAVRAVQQQEDYALAQFSEPVGIGQDLTGLLSLSNTTELKYTIDGSQVKVYTAQALLGNYTFSIHKGIVNSNERPLQAALKANLLFENKLPAVTIAGSGTILPNSGKLVLPFEAINLKAVDLTIVKVYENNLPQFFQTNNYTDANELRRVGKPLLQKKIRLDEDKTLNLHKKNRFVLDLDEIIKAEPGAMYRISLSFRHSYNLLNCAEGTLGTTDQDEEDGEYYGQKIDEDDQFWAGYDRYYSAEYRWTDKDNPCTPSYYTSDRWASRNLLVSNIGLIAKRGNDRSMQIIATDLRSTKGLAGTTLEILDYQRQIILTTKTDGDGMVTFELPRKPFLLIARNGDERAYLKLDDGSSLPLSRFDVAGEQVQNGLKGYIYGERGVWRPGDSLFLSFILEDKLKKLPPGYPVTFELYNPQGQLYQKSVSAEAVNGFYTFKPKTENSSPTGNWNVKVKAGGATFQQRIKIETVMPNRLKIDFNIGNRTFLGSGNQAPATLTANWLFGAAGKDLKAKVDVNLNPMKTTFKGYEAYQFDNPTANYTAEIKTIFEGRLNAEGKVAVNTNLNENNVAPGILKANFSTKVFEAGGNFSIDNFTVPYHVFNHYYGIKVPEGEKLSGMLYTNKDHIFDLVNLDRSGRLVAGQKQVQVELYKVQWRWWWEQEDEHSFANFTQNEYNKLVSKDLISLNQGKGKWKLRINEPEWGRYLILVRDLNGGHVTGKAVYVDWPGWAQREQASNPTEASMLSFTANKTKFKVGEEITLTIPTGENGRALISIENGSKVLKTFWTDTKAGQTQFKFKAEKEMAPNVFANITLLQPHAQTLNDLPIRMYGAIPLLIEDPQTVLNPQISMPDKIRPETANSIKVSERQGKAMTYTLAIVDEGLLDLTRFKTPDPHAVFYAREGLGVKTWDLFDQVLGAWGGNLERILSIGGDGSLNKNLNPAKANRFSAVLKYMGPFKLAKGETKTHQFKLPQYIGAVRVMVVAGQDGAYGQTEKSVQVKKPLMVLATLPRMIGPGEKFTLPVTVFATEPHLKKVNLKLATQNLLVSGGNQKLLSFDRPGEQMAYFEVTAPQVIGLAKVNISIQSGAEKANYTVEMDIRNPNPYLSQVIAATIEPGQSWTGNYKPIGITGTNSGSLEISGIPSLNLKKRLSFLMQYPHGCVEQTTSAVFPQLYLNKLSPLSPAQKSKTDQHITAGITKLRSHQTTDGGLAYWPGMPTADEWGTNYAAHFLVEAQQAGFTLPANMLDELIRYLKTKATAWVPNSTNFYGGDLAQAYRLYVLALARKPEMAAMNRLRTFEYLSETAKWRLAAAYQLAGQASAAQALIKNLSIEIPAYQQLGGTFGSAIRDEAMILETLTLMGQRGKAGTLLQHLASKLGQDEWYSTQTTAYSLLAIAKFCGNSKGSNLQYSYLLDGKKGSYHAAGFINSTALNFNGNQASISNTGKSMLFARLILEGQPAAGQDIAKPQDPNILDMTISYKLLNGKTLNPSRLSQGLDFYAEVTIKNPGKMGYYEQMALTQIFPSGWEIINTRLSDNEGAMAGSPYTYRDIRDDRVLTYFNLRENETVTYKVLLNASYLGRYYLPAVSAEAMYNNQISAMENGMWVEVIK